MTQIITPVMAAFTPVKYALKLVELLYNDNVLPNITNTTYEGSIKDSGDRVRVRTAGKISLSAYTKGMQLVKQELTPTSEDLIIDKQYYFSFGVDDVDKIQNDIPAIAEYAKNTKNDMEDLVNVDVLSYMAKSVNSANMVGTAYATGTAAVAATTGVVTGSGTTFTSGMVGGIFTITGLSNSYLVTAFTSTTEITIKDLDGVAYTGGAVSATTYSIAGAVALALTKSNVYQYIISLRTALGKSLSPKSDRFLVVNSQFEGLLLQAPEFIPAVQTAYSDVVVKGLIGSIAGFKVFTTENIAGNNTTGYWFVAGNKTYCSLAMQIMKTSVIPSEMSEDSFITTCKGLLVWGRKVFAGNRGHGAVLRGTLA
jgi:hypothetical protein